jgi:hypothetical protein
MASSTPRQWYYRKAEEEFGPLEWNEIRRMVKSGELTSQDEIRISRNGYGGQWQSLARMVHLLPEMHEAPTAAADHVLEAKFSGLLLKADAAIEGLFAARSASWLSFTNLIDTLRAMYELVLRFFCWWVDVAIGCAKRLQRFAAPIAVVLLIVVVNAGLWFWSSMDSEQTQFQKVATIGARITELRRRKVNPAEWQAFVAESRKTLKELVPTFEKHATAMRPVQQHLLWASRDCLLGMLDGPPDQMSSLEKSYQLHIREVTIKLSQGAGG